MEQWNSLWKNGVKLKGGFCLLMDGVDENKRWLSGLLHQVITSF